MAARYPAHVCALPGCDVITHNLKYCSKACASAAQVIQMGEGERICVHCHATKSAADFIHVNPSGERRLRSWCSACRGMLSGTAQDRRTATIRARAVQRREAAGARMSALADDRPPVVVDAKGLRPAVLMGDLLLGHPAWAVPGNSILAAPFAA